eukprot:415862-Prymnesium_polylepis.1
MGQFHVQLEAVDIRSKLQARPVASPPARASSCSGGAIAGASSGSSKSPVAISALTPIAAPAPAPSPKALGKRKLPSGVASDRLVAWLLPARHVGSTQAERLAQEAGCHLVRPPGSTPPSIVLEGSPQQLSDAAKLLLQLHISKDGRPKLQLACDDSQAKLIHGEHSRGLRNLKAQTMCKITMSSADEQGWRKVVLEGGDNRRKAAEDVICAAVMAIAELWRPCSAGVAQLLSCQASELSSTLPKPIAEPLRQQLSSQEQVQQRASQQLSSQEQLRKRAERFGAPVEKVPQAAEVNLNPSRSPVPTSAADAPASGSSVRQRLQVKADPPHSAPSPLGADEAMPQQVAGSVLETRVTELEEQNRRLQA